jgi:IclR family KDG regulon transcriptional repressor
VSGAAVPDGETSFVPVKSADRVFDVLELLAPNEPMRLNAIADALSMPYSSAFNLLRTMAHRRYLDYEPGEKRYRIGGRLSELAEASERGDDLVLIAQPLMDALVGATGETVQLAVLDGVENVYLAISESPHPMKLVSKVGSRLSAHATGVGKTLLAQLPDEEVRRRLKGRRLRRYTPSTIVGIEQLLATLHTIRERGWGTDEEEYVLGCRCVAMPVRGRNGATAAMSVSIPTVRYDDAVGRRALTRLRTTVARLEALLGHGEPAGSAAD